MLDPQNHRVPALGGFMSGLSESERTHQALNIAKIVFYAFDVPTNCTIRSDNSMSIVGLPSTGISDKWLEIIDPEDVSQYRAAMHNVTEASPGFEVEYRIRHAITKNQFWVLDRGEAEFGQDGKIRAIRGAIIDISSRISVESELRKAARLRAVAFQAARMAAWHMDIPSKKLICTDELLVLLEVKGTRFDGTLDAVERAIHPDDVDAWRMAHEKALTPGGHMEIEFRVLLPEGGVRWLLSRGEIIRGVDGTPLESYGVMIDITERKSAEVASSRLAAIVASSEDAIISKSLNGVVTSWNRGAEKLFGYSEQEMIGEPITKVIPHSGFDEEQNILRTIRQGDAIAPYESTRLHKNGKSIDVSIAISPIRNAQGKVIGASTIARDITERRKHVETLRQNEARLRLALKSARAGAWDYDLQKRELHWSPEMFALYGRDPVDGLPTREDLSAQISPTHRKRTQKEFSKAMLQGGSFTLEFPIHRPDGSEIWTALVGDVVKDGEGRPISARGIDQDITERKNWEKRQAMLLRELSHRVKNTLAVIQSVARQTLRTSTSPKSFVEAFEGRVRSLAASHSLLVEADWNGAKLDTVIRHQLSGLVDNIDDRVTLRGPSVMLTAEVATQLGLVIHELGTNAAKYGALSVPKGHVDLVWRASLSKLRLMWRERGGPRIEAEPTHTGFGTSLILSSALKVWRDFDPEGLTCKLHISL
jgi:PAS domain S-box-containing protein